MTATPEDLAPDFASLAAETRRLEPRVVRVPTRTSDDHKTVLIIETAGLAARRPRAHAHPP